MAYDRPVIRTTPGADTAAEERQSHLWDQRQLKRATDDTYMANRVRLERIAATIGRILPPQTGARARVLNIGAGDARLEGMLLARGYDVHLVDPSPSIIDFVRERYGLDETRARSAWGQDLPFEADTFDCVVMSEVIEHLSPEIMTATFAQVRRVLKEGGYFIGTVPDNENLAAHRYTCAHCGESSHRVGHEQTFTVPALHAALSPYFTVVRAHSFRGMYMNWRGILYHHWIDLPFKFARMVKPNVRAPHQIVFNIFFVARKPRGTSAS